MNLDIKKILVPTDFSASSASALNYAAYIAKKTDAAIVLLNVMETYDLNMVIDGESKSDTKIENQIKAKLEETLKQHPKLKGYKKSAKFVKGKIYKEILNAIITEDIDLVVMGKNGASTQVDKDKFILGANTQRVLEGAPLPVITVRKRDKVQFDNIVLPLDVTKTTTKKVNTAISWAKIFGSKIHVVTVNTFLEDFTADVTTLKKQLQLVADEIAKNKVKCTTKMIKYKNVTDSIADYSKIVKGDMIIIMKSEDMGLKRYGLSSRGRKVVAASQIPVMSINPPIF